MCNTCLIQNRTKIVASNPLKADPTRTTQLRLRFEQLLRGKFAKLKQEIFKLIVEEDVFGIKRKTSVIKNEERNDAKIPKTSTSNVSLYTSKRRRQDANTGGLYNKGNKSSSQLQLECNTLDFEDTKELESKSDTSPRKLSESDIRQLTVNQPGRWQFQTTSKQVESFENWIQDQIDEGILDGKTGKTKSEGYWRAFSDEGYTRGARRAFNDTRMPALSTGRGVSDFFDGTRDEFLRQSFGRPVAIDKLKLLAGRVFTDLQGITTAMSTQLSRQLVDGLSRGAGPATIAAEMLSADGPLQQIGARRATLLARTEIIRAHAEGQLDAFENLGVTEIGVMAEWSTAGDDRVCPLCEALEGSVMTVKEARGLIPRHAQCRCAFLPANVGESTKKQVRGQKNLQQAIDDSIQAEIPKGRIIKGGARRFQNPVTGEGAFTFRTKRTLAQQKTRSRWLGADRTISKRRPKAVVKPLEKPSVAKPIPPILKKALAIPTVDKPHIILPPESVYSTPVKAYPKGSKAWIKKSDQFPQHSRLVDPRTMRFTERKEDLLDEALDFLRDKFPEPAKSPPIVVKTSRSGKFADILDGHHRNQIARDNNSLIHAVFVSEEEHGKLVTAGFDPIEISHAVLVRSGNRDAAAELVASLGKSAGNLSNRGKQALAVLKPKPIVKSLIPKPTAKPKPIPKQEDVASFGAKLKQLKPGTERTIPPTNLLGEPGFDRLIVGTETQLKGVDFTQRIVVFDAEATTTGQGAFKKSIAKLKKQGLPIRMDNVQTERFREGLERLGFKRSGDSMVWNPSKVVKPLPISAKVQPPGTGPTLIKKPIKKSKPISSLSTATNPELSLRDTAINNPEVLQDLKIPKRMYHVTSKDRIASIQKNGLQISKRASSEGEILGSYMTDDPQDVILKQFDIDIPTDQVVILEIDTTQLKGLRLDPEYFYWDDVTKSSAQNYIRAINEGEETFVLYSRDKVPPSAISIRPTK